MLQFCVQTIQGQKQLQRILDKRWQLWFLHTPGIENGRAPCAAQAATDLLIQRG